MGDKWNGAALGFAAALAVTLAAFAAGDAPGSIRWDAATDTPAAFLARVEQAGAGLAAMPRLLATGPEAVVLAAASAQALGGNAPASLRASGDANDRESAAHADSVFDQLGLAKP